MQCSFQRWNLYTLVFSILAIFTSLLMIVQPVQAVSLQSGPQKIAGKMVTNVLTPAIDQDVQQVLLNMHQNGYNPNAVTSGVTTGGLYINWQMDNPSNVNAGQANNTIHDFQTDLYYVNAIAEYKWLHPQDHSYDADLNKYLPIVEYEFGNYNLPKGWVYFYLLRDGFLLNNTFLLQEAYVAAYHYYTNWYNPQLGLVYDNSHTPGTYSTEHTLMAGAALIDAGIRWNQPQWTQAGKSTINIALASAFNVRTQLLYNNMTVLSNGAEQVQNYQAKPSTQGAAVEALVDAYEDTNQEYYLDIAYQILHSTLESSALWDQTNGGLFFALDLDTNTLEQGYKETRSQAQVLIGLNRYNEVMRQLGRPQQFLDRQQQLINLLTTNFYQPVYHGYFYRITPTFQIYTSSPGQGIGYEDFFTTEAMGLAMDAMQQSEFSYISF